MNGRDLHPRCGGGRRVSIRGLAFLLVSSVGCTAHVSGGEGDADGGDGLVGGDSESFVCLDLSGRLPATVTGDVWVTRDGDDANDGTSRASAKATIQQGVDLLQPGQTLVIGPGEYRGPIWVDHLGSAEADTVIRAEIPGTVLIRGDVPAPAFEAVPGSRWVWVADFVSDDDIQVMNELDTLRILDRAPNAAELEFSPGHFYQDRDAGRLYVASSDTAPADEHFYTLTVTNTHGFYLDAPVRVRVEGLTVTGFNNYVGRSYGEQTLWATYGIFIRNGRNSVIEDSQAFANGRGLGLSNEYDDTSGDNLITGCRAWGNGGVGLSYDTGGIDLLYSRRDEVRDSVAFLNSANGISMRGGVTNHSEADASFIRDSLSWGNLKYDFWIKMGTNYNFYERCVTPGRTGNTNHLRQSVTGSGNVQGTDSIVLNQETDLDPGAEFVDPDNYDFRLQARSRFIGAAPDGSDRGAFAFDGSVRFLDPAGDDSGDGRSVDQAYGTPASALAGMAPGDTLYLTPGRHAGDFTITLSGTEAEPILIRGRGLEPVVIGSPVRVVDSQHVRFERIHFEQDVLVENSDGIAFDNDVFLGTGTALTAANAVGLRVTQSTFTGFSTAAVSLPCSAGAFLAGNLYDNADAAALEIYTPDGIQYADYNSYAERTGAWWLGPEAGTLADVQAGHDLAAQELTPVFVDAGDTVRLDNPVTFYGGGTVGNPFGAFRRDVLREELILLDGPTLHSVSATTANVEWLVNHPAVTTLSWGPTEAVENQTTLDVNRFGSFSLTGLTPDTTYYLRLDSLRIPDDVDLLAEPVTVTTALLSFTTAAADAAPQTYYVATDGDDANDGLAPATAFRSIQRAADQVNVGDTVIVGGGTYYETVRIRATGTPTAPITFQGQIGEQVILDGAEALLDFAFVIGKKSHLRFDNFFFAYHGSTYSESGAWELYMGGQFNIYASEDIQISRVLSDGRTTGDRLVVAKNVDGLRLTNVVDGNKLEGHYFENCPNLVIENCVFARPMIAAFILRNYGGIPSSIHHTIFTDSLAVKSYQDTLGNPNNVYLIVMDAGTAGAVMEDNLFFLRYFSPEERNLINSSGFDELENVVLFDTMFADPAFQGVADLLDAGGTLSLYDDSQPPFPPDSLWSLERPFTFRTWMATDAAVLGAGIGLDPSQFDAVSGLPN